LAARSSGRSRLSGKRRTQGAAAAPPVAEADRDEITERARGLGITPERVLQEYARIAFADLRRVADWGRDGLHLKEPDDLDDADAAAISEVVGGTGGGLRIKLYDKKAALDAIARHLGMFVRPLQRQDDGSPGDLAEDAREVLARRLARLAAGGAEE
jgi:Terminase small subunit